jgi:hypothetical protein
MVVIPDMDGYGSYARDGNSPKRAVTDRHDSLSRPDGAQVPRSTSLVSCADLHKRNHEHRTCELAYNSFGDASEHQVLKILPSMGGNYDLCRRRAPPARQMIELPGAPILIITPLHRGRQRGQHLLDLFLREPSLVLLQAPSSKPFGRPHIGKRIDLHHVQNVQAARAIQGG